MSKVIALKRKMNKHEQKNSKLGQIGQGLNKKEGEVNTLLKKQTNLSLNSHSASKKSQRISRYSNVNIAMLNNVRSLENEEEEIDNNFTKQTKFEQRITMLTIKRTMTCFFLIIFSIPFFIETTYKSYLSEYHQLSNFANTFLLQNDTIGYQKLMRTIVEQHSGDFDSLVYLSGPNFIYKSGDYADNKIRAL